MKIQDALAKLSVAVILVGFGAVQAEDLDPSIYSEDVPEILNQGPDGMPATSVVRDMEGVPEIDRLGPRGSPARVVVRDGEGVPEIDRLGPSGYDRFAARSGDR